MPIPWKLARMFRGRLTDVSFSCLAVGSSYTYCSGDVCTKVDYALMNADATSMLSSVSTRDMVDLNTSDHLPIVVEFKGADCSLEGIEVI